MRRVEHDGLDHCVGIFMEKIVTKEAQRLLKLVERMRTDVRDDLKLLFCQERYLANGSDAIAVKLVDRLFGYWEACDRCLYRTPQ